MTSHPARADSRADGSFLHRITGDYVTPHLNWAKPLAGGSIKTLVIVSRKAAREVVELAQRVEIDQSSIVAYDLNALALDSVYEALVTGTSAHEKAGELAQKLEGNYDAVILANVDFKALSLESQYKILQKVSDGAGLLIVYPRAPANPKMLAHPTQEGKQILRMIDVAALPGEAGKSDAEKLFKTYRFGKGRIGTISYPRPAPYNGLGLTAFEEYSPSGWKARYENNIAFVGRALQWAAGRDTTASVTPVWPAERLAAGQGVLLRWQVQGVEQATLHLRMRDEWNTVQWSGEAAVQNGRAVAVELPALAAGVHYLDVQLERDGKIAAFGVFRCEVASPVGKIEITTNKESYERGETVTAGVRLERGLDQNAELRVRPIWTRN